MSEHETKEKIKTDPTFSQPRQKLGEPINASDRTKKSVDQSTKTTESIKTIIKNKPYVREQYTKFSQIPWYWSIPSRIYFVFNLIFIPFRIALFALEFIVASAVVGLLVVGWLCWIKVIPDDQVSLILAQLVTRGLGILTKSGVVN